MIHLSPTHTKCRCICPKYKALSPKMLKKFYAPLLVDAQSPNLHAQMPAQPLSSLPADAADFLQLHELLPVSYLWVGQYQPQQGSRFQSGMP